MWFIIGGTLVFFFSYLSFRDKGPIDPTGQVIKLPTKYDTNIPWFLAWFRTKASKIREALANQLNSERNAVIGFIAQEETMMQTQANVDYAPQQIKNEQELKDATQELNMTVVRSAQDMRVDLATYFDIRKQQESEKLEIQKRQEFEKMDVQRRWIEIEQNLKAGFIYHEREWQYLTMHQEYIFGLFDELTLLQGQRDSFAKTLKVKFLNKRIRDAQKAFNGRQKRLLQTTTRKELRAGDEDTDLTRNPE